MDKKDIVLHQYEAEFNRDSAEVILPFLYTFHPFKTVGDIGCGLGNWLLGCLGIGAKQVLRY